MNPYLRPSGRGVAACVLVCYVVAVLVITGMVLLAVGCRTTPPPMPAAVETREDLVQLHLALVARHGRRMDLWPEEAKARWHHATEEARR